MMGGHSKVAGGNIAPSRFVKLDPSNTGRVLQAGANDPIYGISQPATHNIALSGGGFSSTDDGFAAVAGEELMIYGPGDPGVPLELGGTVSNGDYLKSDANGKGVTGSTDKDQVGAQTNSAGTAGVLVPVEVMRFDRSV